MTTDSASNNDHGYEAPTLTEVGTVRTLTQGHFLSPGHDNLSFIPIAGALFGS